MDLPTFAVSKVIAVLGLVIVVDFVSGLLSAKLSPNDTIISKKWNDGLIRKGNMLFAAFSCLLFDLITGIDLLPYIPFSDTLHTFGFVRLGVCEVISIGLIGGEIKSIFENWEKANIKTPGFLKSIIAKISNLFSGE